MSALEYIPSSTMRVWVAIEYDVGAFDVSVDNCAVLLDLALDSVIYLRMRIVASQNDGQ